MGGRIRVGVCLVAAWAACVPLWAQTNEYLPEDVKITGKEIHAFTHDGRPVMVVLGDFHLRLGRRTVSARDAVVWVVSDEAGEIARRRVVLYLSGKAKVVEPNGATTTDDRMLVTLQHHGRLSAKGAFVDKPLTNYPLFRQAVVAREKYLPAGMWLAQPVRLRDGQATPTTSPTTSPTTLPTTAPVTTRSLPPTTTPTTPLPPLQVVSIRLGRVTTQKVDVGRGFEQRITLCRGDDRGRIYLALGTNRSTEYVELQAQSMVAFSENRPDKQARVPWSPRLASMPGTNRLKGGPADWKETLVGVYLEGDVVISRGERIFRGTRAYYDFTSDRAIILNAVFTTVQKQRNVPVIVRAAEARTLSARETWFRDAKVSTNEFATPTYHIGASTAYVKDTTPYAPDGTPVGPDSFETKIRNATLNVGGVPLLYWPYTVGSFEEDSTALRRLNFGGHGQYGFGVESEWHLFRLLGILRPEGFRGRLRLNWYERGPLVGAKIDYARKDYHGFWDLFGMQDKQAEDDFGDTRKDIAAPEWRGRILVRHKQRLADDWLLQFELSYWCDKNFLEQFARAEYWSGKEQETLLYAKKAADNWAFTGLLKYRLNRFQTQDEAFPDFAFFLMGQPLFDNRVMLYSESHAGFVRQRYANDVETEGSGIMLRADTRNEVTFPLKWGPVVVTPYAVGRATYWQDEPVDGEQCRLAGEAGVKAVTHLWRVYNNVYSRLWDVNRLKHIISPELAAYVGSTGGVQPYDLYPLSAEIERNRYRQSGVSIGVHQRLQTKRGTGENRHTVDWMRLSIVAGFYANGRDPRTSDGHFTWYRPENSFGRNHINGEYAWQISDSTTFLADANYDIDSKEFRRANAGLAVVRSSRLRYYLGWRYISQLDSSVGTFGFNYELSQKYSIGFLEQYDFNFRGSKNLGTQFSIIRKFPRWYVAVTFSYIRNVAEGDDIGLVVSVWPQGVPEFRVGGQRLYLLGNSTMN